MDDIYPPWRYATSVWENSRVLTKNCLILVMCSANKYFKKYCHLRVGYLYMLEHARVSLRLKNIDKYFTHANLLAGSWFCYCLIYISSNYQEFSYRIFGNMIGWSPRNHSRQLRLASEKFEKLNTIVTKTFIITKIKRRLHTFRGTPNRLARGRRLAGNLKGNLAVLPNFGNSTKLR